MSDCTPNIGIEKFAANDLSGLREDLLQSGFDSRQVAELIRSFLAERGYGISHDAARGAATNAAIFYGPLHRMQETLEQIAVLM